MADYSALLDAEILAFIRKSESFPSEGEGLEAERRAYARMCAAFRQERPEGVTTEDRRIGQVPVRVYEQGEPSCTVVYAHGGGFVKGGLESHDDICAEICNQTGYRVVAVDYRLAPEHAHPAAFDDCFAAVEWVEESLDLPIVLAGDSAGATLMASVAHHARGRLRNVIGQVLIYPALGADGTGASYRDHAEAPLLSAAALMYYRGVRSGGVVPAGDATYSPLLDKDFDDLPRTVIFTAECDPGASDGADYARLLEAADVPVKLVHERGLVHGFLRARHMSARADASFERIVLAIEALGQGLWVYE